MNSPTDNPQPKSCSHQRTRVIAEDEHEKYLECLDCGAILEAGELQPAAAPTESLSDA
jgi:hypothetical protein